MIIRLFLTSENYKKIAHIEGLNSNNLEKNLCYSNPITCWLHPDSFKYDIDFFGILELYSYSGNIYMVEEGYYTKG